MDRDVIMRSVTRTRCVSACLRMITRLKRLRLDVIYQLDICKPCDQWPERKERSNRKDGEDDDDKDIEFMKKEDDEKKKKEKETK